MNHQENRCKQCINCLADEWYYNDLSSRQRKNLSKRFVKDYNIHITALINMPLSLESKEEVISELMRHYVRNQYCSTMIKDRK